MRLLPLLLAAWSPLGVLGALLGERLPLMLLALPGGWLLLLLLRSLCWRGDLGEGGGSTGTSTYLKLHCGWPDCACIGQQGQSL